MLELARLSDAEAPVPVQELATWTGISRRYLEQLMIPLRRAGLVRGRSGRAGGYALTRDPASIRVGDVLASAIGPVTLVKCVDHEGACARAERCECRLVWTLLNDRVRDVLDEYSLADLADPGWRSRMQAELQRRRAARASKNRGRA
jgi:Rrf2 family protein